MIFKFVTTEHMRGPNKRGYLRRPNWLCPGSLSLFYKIFSKKHPAGLITRILDFDPTSLP